MIIELSESALLQNFDCLTRNRFESWPCLKRDAYGVGIETVLSVLLASRKLEGVCTDTISDLPKIRKAFSGNLLYFGELSETSLSECSEYRAIPSASHVNHSDILTKCPQVGEVFVEVNSGLNRYGCDFHELETMIASLNGENVAVSGVLAHFQNQTERDFQKNVEFFNNLRSVAEKFGIRRISLLSTETICHYGDLYPSNLTRPGIGLFGYFSSPIDKDFKLSSAITIKTRLTGVRFVGKGERVGYARKSLKSDVRVGIIPTGYADGISKSVEGKGWALIRGKRCPILSVSMSNAFLDMRNVDPSVGEGEPVTLVGAGADLYSWAEWMGTIPQEALLSFCRGKKVCLKKDSLN